MKTDIVPSYSARVMDVISGDDLIVMVDLGIDDLFKKVRARLQGVDTPDAFRTAADTVAGQIRNDVRKLTKGKQCRIDVHVQGRGGWVVTLFIGSEDGELNLNEMLRDKGFVYQSKSEKVKYGPAA